MSVPSVNLTRLDGQIGAIPPGANGDVAAIISVSDDGPENTPAAFARGADIVATYGAGPLVELASAVIDATGLPVVVCRMTDTNGSYGAVALTGTGTSVPTAHAATYPNDEYEIYILVVVGGTIGSGTPAITYQWSLDGGRTLSPVTALGTAAYIVVPGSGGARIDFAAGNLVAGDVIKCRTVAPAGDPTAAYVALAQNSLAWNYAVLDGITTTTRFDAFATWLESLRAARQYSRPLGLCNARGPASGESEAAYYASLSAAFASHASTYVSVGAGYARTVSAVSRRQYRRPVAWVAAAQAGKIFLGQDMASVGELGPLAGVSIRDDSGNPVEHDEDLFPGLDDARFLTLRSIPGRTGVYVTNPTLMSPVGSDFQYWQHTRAMNEAEAIAYRVLVARLSRGVRYNLKSGFILRAEAEDIENAVNAEIRAKLMSKPSVSATQFTVSRTDDLRVPAAPLNCQNAIMPLKYLKQINVNSYFTRQFSVPATGV